MLTIPYINQHTNPKYGKDQYLKRRDGNEENPLEKFQPIQEVPYIPVFPHVIFIWGGGGGEVRHIWR